MCRLRDVDVQYRSNLDAFRQWETQEDAKQKASIRMFKYRESQHRKGFKVPGWVAALGALGILGALVWVFRAVVIR